MVVQRGRVVVRRVLGVSLCLVALVVGSAPLSGKPAKQDLKYRLRDVMAAGDVGTVTQSMEMNMKVRASAEGRESPDMPVYNRTEATYTMSVLSADAKGQPTGARLRFSRYRSAQRQFGKKPFSTVSSAEGKTVTVKRGGGRTTVTVNKGKLSAADRAQLSQMLDDVNDPMPTEELFMGEEWSSTTEKLAKSFGLDGTASVSGRLVEMVQRSGHPCVRSELQIEVTGRPKTAPLDVTLKLTGSVYYATDLKRTLYVSLSGPMTISGEMMQSGTSIFFAGDGTAKFTYTSRWTKANGKAVKS
jgi:hypothetical protein